VSIQTELPPLDLDLDLEALERAFAPTLSERLQRAREAVAVRLRRNWPDWSLLSALLILAAVVQARGMYISPARFDDEGTYTAYAWAVANLHRLAHYTYWYAHPPLGQLQMALYNELTNAFGRLPYAVATGREFALVCKLISVLLLFRLARRLEMGRLAAVLAVAMFSLSPLAVYFQRTALLDNLVTPWLLAAFFFAASPRRSIRAAAASAACFAIAVLSKETALLFMPAVLLLFFQRTDRRNRKFTIIMFAMVVSLLGLMYPLYALIKNELWDGPGHVSLQWAIQWQLFDRTGSGSIFDPKSTAHTVVMTWISLDRWSCLVCLAAVVPGLLLRRTRAVALAFAIQVSSLLRSGYLPYPFVIAMIPFAVLTFAGVVDAVWKWSGLDRARLASLVEPLRARLAGRQGPAWEVVLDDGRVVPLERRIQVGREPAGSTLETSDLEGSLVRIHDESKTLSREHLDLYSENGAVFVVDHGSTNGTIVTASDGARSRCQPGIPSAVPLGASITMGQHSLLLRDRGRGTAPVLGRALAVRGRTAVARSITRGGTGLLVAAVVLSFALAVAKPWWYGLQDLWTNDRDAGKAAALAWLESNTGPQDTLVVDDAFWVDLVRHGHPSQKVIWFTKLDVDKDVALPTKEAWRGIDYVVLDHQDTLSLHLNDDLTPSRDTQNQFPTIAKAITNGRLVASFGATLDRAMIWRVSTDQRPAGQPATLEHKR
jgi:hypothetical protein